MSGMNYSDAYKMLQEITALAREIEDVPNLPQDIWTMQKIDEKAARISSNAQIIADFIAYLEDAHGGTGSG